MNDNKENLFKYKFKLKPFLNCILIILLLINNYFILGYMPEFSFLRSNFITQYFPDVYSHISNFGISLNFYLGIGIIWLLLGVDIKKITILGIIFIIGNILSETVMGFMNTTDLIDMTYGIAGTLIGFIFLYITSKRGLMEND